MTGEPTRIRLAAMLVVLCGVVAAPGALAQTVVIREFLFDVPGVLPSAEPEVVFSGSGGLTEADVFAVAGGLLEQRTFGVGTGNYSYTDTGGGLDPALTTVLEARLRIPQIESGPPDDDGGLFFQVFDGASGYRAFFSLGAVRVGAAVPFAIADLDEFHTYRLVSPGGSDELWFFVDGVLVVETSGEPSNLDGFGFGDGITSAGNNADADWDTLRILQVPVAGGSLLCNGSFEVGAGEADVPCWDVSGSFARTDTQGAADGMFTLNLNGSDLTPDAVVSQTVPTIPGVTYELTFAFGAFSDSFPGTLQELGIQATGAATLLDETIDDTASDPTTFESFVFQFTADSDMTMIVFTDLSIETLSVDGNLDDVRLLPLICGDGAQATSEQCDDGNTVAGDGCSAVCEVEGGAGVCGDGTLDAGEQCDDGNTVAGDGCDAGCQNEGGAFVCAPAPIEGCLVAAKASVSISEKKAGKEKWKAKLKGFSGATAQSDLGDPLSGSTRYDLCLYDGAGQLAGELSVDRAGQTCGPKQKPCFKDKGGKGWLYKDPSSEASGTKKLTLGSGPIGKGKATWQAGNKTKKGQTSLPTGTAAALNGATSATLQLVTSDAACFEAGLETVKKADGVIFKAKAP